MMAVFKILLWCVAVLLLLALPVAAIGRSALPHPSPHDLSAIVPVGAILSAAGLVLAFLLFTGRLL